MKLFSCFLLYTVLLLLFTASCSSDNGAFVEYSEEIIREQPNINQNEEKFIFTAGSYENALIAIDGDKITGVFQPDKKSCNFYFEAILTGKKTESPLKWSIPGSSKKGEGSISADFGYFILKINENTKSGCPEELLKSGIRLNLEKANNWKSILLLKTKSMSIFSEPEEGMEIGQNFKKGDVICVLESKKDWLRVEKIGKNTQAGWVKASDLEQ